MIDQLRELKTFTQPKADLEQYVTHPEIASDWLTNHQDDFTNKHVLDLGCGTGMLGITAGLLGAKKITFLDIDKEALEICKANAKILDCEYEIIHSPLKSMKADVVIMNPPFGTKNRHADKQFIIAACMSAPIIHSMHLQGSQEFIAQVAGKYHHTLTAQREFHFSLEKTMTMHTQDKKMIRVITVRLAQQDL
jgi:putative methylase